ncbi:MAG: ABC transporter ATP-binding protein [Nitrososphaerota archaeon]|nr:ABC transporter ATP-binding protein [Nitrososphaerota archaeon]
MLELDSVSVSYGTLNVLNTISMNFQDNEFVCIIGSNGMGKSTLLRTITGFVHPREGRVMFSGQDISHSEPHEIIRLGISMVPEGRHVFPLMTVRQNLLLAGNIPRAREKREQNTENVVKFFPALKEKMNSLAGNLSGGQQQQLSVARALMQEPDIIMLDEPSLGLSPLAVKSVYEALREIKRSNPKLAIVLVEQNAKVALENSDRGYVLEFGKVALSGTSSELKQNALLREKYLGVQAS